MAVWKRLCLCRCWRKYGFEVYLGDMIDRLSNNLATEV